MKKLIATILILGVISSISFGIFIFKPKEAKALDGGGSWAGAIKETVLDAIGWTVSDMVLNRLMIKIQNWGMGRSNDSNEPFAVIDWKLFFKQAINIGSARFISEAGQIFSNSPDKFTRTIGRTLESIGFLTYSSDLPLYSQYARPTLIQELGNNIYEDFINSGYSIQRGGWTSWFSLIRPQNNIFGQILMAEQARERYEIAEKEASDKETAVSDGLRNETITTQTDIDQCKQTCEENATDADEDGSIQDDIARCQEKCQMKPGVALETRIKNWGADIHKAMDDALGKDMQRIISADEITELIGVFFSAVLNKAINGLGLAFSPKSSTAQERQRAEYKERYSYNRVFKKEQTMEQMQDTRSTVLTTTLKAMQQLSRSIISCNEKEMMKEQDYAKNLADVLAAEVEALYVGLEGLNLKPDFEVLDPHSAPYTVYGFSWGHLPANKFPSKCKKITDQLGLVRNPTCRSIKSGLEPNYSLKCDQCMYDHNALNCPPDPVPPFPSPNFISESLIKQKEGFFDSCRDPYFATLNVCESCIKKVDEKCGQLDEDSKQQCILNNCSNYRAIADKVIEPITDGLDFYNKCLIEEKKDACYTCVKEYFMPATYCDQTKDYMARSIVKYPALLKEMHRSNEGTWIGPEDKIIAKLGGKCDDNEKSEPISLALICRILPDFKYQNEKVCETKCSQSGLTEEQLRNIADFRPSEKDCQKIKLPIGGREPWQIINDGVLHARGKCCAAFWQYDKEKYELCVGSAGETETDPGQPPSACHVDEGEKGWEAITNMSLKNSDYPAFSNIIRKREALVPQVILRSNRDPFRGATVYITKPFCDAVKTFTDGTPDYESDINNDGQFDDEWVNDPAGFVNFLGYCRNKASGEFKSPTNNDIICKFVLSQDGEGGEAFKYCGDLSSYSIRNTWMTIENPKGGAELCVCKEGAVCEKYIK